MYMLIKIKKKKYAIFLLVAVYWLGYEQMKAKVLLETGQKKLTFIESFASGAVAGTVSTISQL